MARNRGNFINIWEVVDLGRREVRNAAILAWLLNPRGNHGQGSSILQELMSRVELIDSAWKLERAVLARARVKAELRPLGSDRDRVDISIDGPNFAIFIEVKIDATEGERQLSRYTEAAVARAAARARACDQDLRPLVILLSPRGPAELVPGLIHLAWNDVALALTGASARSEGLARHFIRSFSTHIRAFTPKE